MNDEKELLYLCDVCDKKTGVAFVVREDGKIINKCQKCYYKKDEK